MASPSCVSNPPKETKKTCLFVLVVAAVEIIRATNFSWSAKEFPEGKGVVTGGAEVKADVRTLPAEIERAATRVYSASNKCVRVLVTSACMVDEHADEPNSGALSPLKATGPDVDTWYCTAVFPERKTALPDTLTQVKVAFPFPDTKRSPILPPQPDAAPSGADDCQTDCWSLWENSFGGRGTEAFVYCALVVGWINVPTLSITPMCPVEKSGNSGDSSGASAYCRPPGRTTDGFRVVGTSDEAL